MSEAMHKASGPDNISSRILKDLQNLIAPILTIIFQNSLQTVGIPTDWKHANVAPGDGKWWYIWMWTHTLVRNVIY
jgi:hypothetical protein